MPTVVPSLSPLVFAALVAGALVVLLFTLGLVLSRLYRKASKELAFVRTGLGGERVIISGGALVLPVFHGTISVNMNTLRLEVQRANADGLITRDRIRVDVRAEFYVRVKPNAESIGNAAQTLGQRTMNPTALKELVEGKFIDALRAVAAEMTMDELHEQRVNFVQRVQATVSEDLLKNGLELEAVSLTSLDQTDQKFLNPQNAFDASGLTKLTMQIEEKRRQRNDIEQETAVAVQVKNLEAERRQLELSRDAEYARMEQEREVSIRRAAQSAEIARERAQRDQESKQAEIGALQAITTAQIASDLALQDERILSERKLNERQIEKTQAIESAEIAKKQAVELAEQGRAIAVAERSRAKSEAEAAASRALADAVQAEEQVATVRAREGAERQKQIELTEASKHAQREAIGVTTAAEAEKQAALDRAEAVTILAKADSDRARIAAEGDAQAETLRADAAARRYEVDAVGRRALNEADNLLSTEVIAMKIRELLIQNLPAIIRESARPMEQIESIKIVQVDGLNGNTGGTGGNGHGAPNGGGNGSLADQVVNSALRYRAQAPLVESILKEVGLDGTSLRGLTALLQPLAEEVTTPALPPPAAPAAADGHTNRAAP